MMNQIKVYLVTSKLNVKEVKKSITLKLFSQNNGSDLVIDLEGWGGDGVNRFT